MCRTVRSATSANTSCRATRLPQSMTDAVLLLMMTCADAELAFRGRGPPPVPRRISRVFAACALPALAQDTALTRAAAPRRNARRSIFAVKTIPALPARPAPAAVSGPIAARQARMRHLDETYIEFGNRTNPRPVSWVCSQPPGHWQVGLHWQIQHMVENARSDRSC